MNTSVDTYRAYVVAEIEEVSQDLWERGGVKDDPDQAQEIAKVEADGLALQCILVLLDAKEYPQVQQEGVKNLLEIRTAKDIEDWRYGFLVDRSDSGSVQFTYEMSCELETMARERGDQALASYIHSERYRRMGSLPPFSTF